MTRVKSLLIVSCTSLIRRLIRVLILALGVAVCGSLTDGVALGQTPDSLWLGTDNTSSRDFLQTDTTGSVLQRIPMIEVTGVALHGDSLITGDSNNGITVRDLSGMPLRTFGLPSVIGCCWEDIASDGTSLWRLHEHGALIQFNVDGEGLSTRPIAGLGLAAIGLAWDGAQLWASEAASFCGQSGGLGTIDLDTNTYTRQFVLPYPGGGLGFDSSTGTMRVGSCTSNSLGKVYNVSLDDGSEISSFVLDGEVRFIDGLG